MSPLVARPLPPGLSLREERRQEIATPAQRLWLEPALVLAVAYLVYAAAGTALLTGFDVVVGDAQSRLAHAYFAWWNEPAKLTAIGFYWPPLQTLVLLPLALVPPLATSLVALPLTSALFGAAILAVLARALAWVEVPRPARLGIVAAFGLNPLFAFYALNGMGEIVYLAFLTVAVWVFLRWSREPRWPDLLVVGGALALATLTRYEIALYTIPIGVAAVVVLLRRRERSQTIEASLLALTVPVLYGLLVWGFLNLTIVGDPLAFLKAGAPPAQPPDPAFDEPLGLALDAVAVGASIFPLTFLVAAALLVLGARRRDVVALTLAALLLLNVATTFALLLGARQGYLLELRYNMRSMPLTVLACAWLLAHASPARLRLGAAALTVALAATIPLTGWTMLRHDRELGERIGTDVVRVRPVSRTEDVVRVALGRPPREDPGRFVDLRSERAMAAFVRRNIAGRNAILTDDSRTFGVMLADGDPGRYLDRIDHGERRWLETLRDPVGKVDYVLLLDRPYDVDRSLVEYPGIATGAVPPFLRLVRREGAYRLYRVDRP